MKVAVTYSYFGRVLPGLPELAGKICHEMGYFDIDERFDVEKQRHSIEMLAASEFQEESGLSSGADSFVFQCVEVK